MDETDDTRPGQGRLTLAEAAGRLGETEDDVLRRIVEGELRATVRVCVESRTVVGKLASEVDPPPEYVEAPLLPVDAHTLRTRDTLEGPWSIPSDQGDGWFRSSLPARCEDVRVLLEEQAAGAIDWLSMDADARKRKWDSLTPERRRTETVRLVHMAGGNKTEAGRLVGRTGKRIDQLMKEALPPKTDSPSVAVELLALTPSPARATSGR
ncbi:MAG: hypothetical protein ACOZEN_09070 [Thermodesulfobacteriota bacterium]